MALDDSAARAAEAEAAAMAKAKAEAEAAAATTVGSPRVSLSAPVSARCLGAAGTLGSGGARAGQLHEAAVGLLHCWPRGAQRPRPLHLRPAARLRRRARRLRPAAQGVGAGGERPAHERLPRGRLLGLLLPRPTGEGAPTFPGAPRPNSCFPCARCRTDPTATTTTVTAIGQSSTSLVSARAFCCPDPTDMRSRRLARQV